MKPHPALIALAAGLCIAATGCEKAMTPEAMSAEVARCHKLGLRAEAKEALVSADRYAVVEVQCHPDSLID